MLASSLSVLDTLLVRKGMWYEASIHTRPWLLGVMEVTILSRVVGRATVAPTANYFPCAVQSC